MLTDKEIKAAKPREKPYKLSDGLGLYLEVQPNGSKLWRMKYRFEGKEKRISFGGYPDTSGSLAREKRDAARKDLAAGLDPTAQRRLDKTTRANTFKEVSEEFLELKAKEQAPKTTEKARWLMGLLYPQIGGFPINKIKASDLLKVLKKIEARGNHETAHRAKQKAGEVFRYGIATDRCEHDVSANLKGALANVVTEHRPAFVKPEEFGAMLRMIDGYQGQPTTTAALKLLPLVFTRPGELRTAEWSEFDFVNNQWNIPASKMKMKLPLVVPLSKQAILILNELRPITGAGKYLFPSISKTSVPISENTLNGALRRLGIDTKTEHCAHGFRASARTMLDEVLQFRIDLIEHQSAHTVKDTNGRAYNRTTHLPERRRMMQEWADYLDVLRTNTKLISN